jgi:hypothetical protein
MGRPLRKEAPSDVITLRVTPDERAWVTAQAAKAGLSVSAWVRGCLGLDTAKARQRRSSPGPNPVATKPPLDTVEQVLWAARRLAGPRRGLVAVPALVRALAPALTTKQAHKALLKAAEQGSLELRPEQGREFLRPEDAALCPPGPRGTVLSYVRLIS